MEWLTFTVPIESSLSSEYSSNPHFWKCLADEPGWADHMEEMKHETVDVQLANGHLERWYCLTEFRVSNRLYDRVSPSIG